MDVHSFIPSHVFKHELGAGGGYRVPWHRLRTTKETIQPNNKAPRRTPSFGSFVSSKWNVVILTFCAMYTQKISYVHVQFGQASF